MEELGKVSKKEYLDRLFDTLRDEVDDAVKIIHKENPVYYFSEDPYYNGQSQLRDVMDPLEGMNSYLFNQEINNITLSIGNANSLPLEIIHLDYGEDICSIQGDNLLQPRNSTALPINTLFEFSCPRILEETDTK